MKLFSLMLLLAIYTGEAKDSETPKNLADGAMEHLYREEAELRSQLYRAGLRERMEIKEKITQHQKRIRLQEQLLGIEARENPSAHVLTDTSPTSGTSWMPQHRVSTPMVWSDERPEPMAWWPDSWKIRLPGPPPSRESPRRNQKPILDNLPIEEETFETPLERPEVTIKKKAILSLLSQHPRQVLSSRQILFGVPDSFRNSSWHLWEKRGQEPWTYVTEGEGDRNFSLAFQEDLPLRYSFTERRHQPSQLDPGTYYFILDTQSPQTLRLSKKVGEYGLTQLNWHFEDLNSGSHPVSLRLLNAEGGVVAVEGALPARGLHILSSHQAKHSVLAEWTVRDEAGNLTEQSLDLSR